MSNQISADSSTSSMWGGRFSEATDSFVAEFTASVGFDQRFANQDIAGSIAHATMLAKAGIITEAEKDQIVGGLTQIKQEIADGKFVWSVALEDVHMNVESRLTAIIGDVGKKLHTGRSRNDQVATDIRLYLRDQTDIILGLLKRLQTGLLDLASQHTDTIMPGFTHLQTAQPVSFGHHVMAWFEMLMRDSERLIDGRKRINQMPLGAAALAGTTYPIEREFTAQLLGFEGICQNSLDAVSDRDFAIEFASSASLLMMHLSRMSEEIILWMSAQFGFVVVPDRFCTGSSIMPQKKNPDMAELIRGKVGRTTGHLMSMLVTLKGLPLAYNKDMQEDKEGLFDAVHTLKGSLRIFEGMVASMKVNSNRLNQTVKNDFSNATELADYLVSKNIPFRTAHEIVGKIVLNCIHKGIYLLDVPLSEYQEHHENIEEDIYDYLTPENCLKRRQSYGSTGQESVKHQLKVAKALLKDNGSK